MDYRDPTRRRRRWKLKLLVVVLLAVGVWISLRVGGRPQAELAADLPGIGPRTTISVAARETDRGLRRVTLELAQGDRVSELERREFETRPSWKLWGPRTAEERFELPVGGEVTEGLLEGEATLRLSVWGARTWLRDPEPVVRELTLPVRLSPPRLSVVSRQHYPTQGGSEAVVYRFGEGVARHGVLAGDAFFPGYPLPDGAPGDHFALFAVPHELVDVARIRLIAEDEVGNRAERAFVDRLKPREVRRDEIALGDAFIERVASEIEAETPSLTGAGGPVERYLAINAELREANRAEVGRLARGTAETFLWEGGFQPLPNGEVMARFADHRTYFYAGREIDQQDHLGYDLASVQRAEVPAANHGVVVAARYLGIYGNVVVIDHGYGLMSLYGHLSTFEVAPGDRVRRGQTIGRTGATGLAGGDHLHFGMFLHTVATDPVEWLDESWIRNRILAKLRPAGTAP